MKVVRLVSLLTSLIVFTALCAYASDELATTLTFTVPGLDTSITAIDLADVDGDGFAEVLATDNHKLVLYSVTRDEVVQSLDIDLFYDANGYGSCTTTNWEPFRANFTDPFYTSAARVLLADVNRDDNFDALLVTRTVCPFGYVHYLVTMFDNVHSGAAPFIALHETFQTALPIGAFDMIDWEDDGSPDLIFSVDSIYTDVRIIGQWSIESTAGRTRVFDDFPESEIARLDYMIGSPVDLSDYGLPRTLLASKTSFTYEDLLLSSYTEYTTGTLALFRIEDALPTLYPAYGYSCYNYQREASMVRDIGCMGAISGDSGKVEVVAPFRWHWRCQSGDYQTPQLVDTSGAMLSLLQIAATDSVVNLWSVDVTGHNYQSFFYHPVYPGAFFAVEADTLFKFDGSDGSVACHYQTLPTGLHIWDYPWPDRPYLVTVSRATVTYQSFDVATDVESPVQSDILPGSFTLGTPYPNPFNPTVSVPVRIPSRGHLKVEVFNSLGQRVDVVCDREMPGGEMTLDWDGSRFSSGVYLFRATADGESRTVKAMLLK